MNVACRICVWNLGWIWRCDGYGNGVWGKLMTVLARRRDDDDVCVIVMEDGRAGGCRIRGMIDVVCSRKIFP